ncbi:GNAT family N-acetyltransferase [Paenibacillus pabuli]|uniref:GNAT family N-acetyltransferase n=1 Tax=Paenibacillus pabuli TaxID=1472 RepID=UPI0032421260
MIRNLQYYDLHEIERQFRILDKIDISGIEYHADRDILSLFLGVDFNGEDKKFIGLFSDNNEFLALLGYIDTGQHILINSIYTNILHRFKGHASELVRYLLEVYSSRLYVAFPYTVEAAKFFSKLGFTENPEIDPIEKPYSLAT